MEWFKFFGSEYLSDPKMLSLTAEERSCWITLLCYASISKIAGEIQYLDEEKLMTISGLSFTEEHWDTTAGVLEKFLKLKMITIDNEIITILNFRKKQDTSLTSYERVKKYRQKKQNDNGNIEDLSINDNIMITNDNEVKQNDNTRIEKKRIEKNRDITTPQEESKLFFNSENKQSKIIIELTKKGISEDFVKAEIKKFISYWTELNKSGTKQKWELEKTFEVGKRLTNWFSNSQKFNNKSNKGIQSL